MKYELTKDEIEEMVECIVDCDLDREEAVKYALAYCGESLIEDAVEV